MNSADSAVRGALLQLTSPQMLAALVSVLCAAMVAYAVARPLAARRLRTAPDLPLPAHGLDHALEGMVILAPILAALATLFAAHVVVGALGISTEAVDAAARLVTALLLVRLGVFVLGLLLGPGSWVRTRGARITLILWGISAVALLGWLDDIEAGLNRVSLVPGKFSLWALLKGMVVVTAFVVVASLIARAIERHVMRLDQLAVSTRVGVSKFTYFLLVGLGVLLGVNAAGVDVTTLNVLTGAHVFELYVAPGSPIDGKLIKDVRWPPETVVASVRRRNKLIVPHGSTDLLGGDAVTIVGEPDAERNLMRMFSNRDPIEA